MKKLTTKQTAVLAALSAHIDEHGYPPTVRELAHAIGYSSSSTVHGFLERLKERGVINWEPSRPRTLHIRHAE